MRILIVDNHDSFVHNITEALERIGRSGEISPPVWEMIRNDHAGELPVPGYDAVILSPGPGLPDEAWRLKQIIGICAAQRIPTLGICLGFQAITEFFGGRLLQLARPRHGHSSPLSRIDCDDPLAPGLTRCSGSVGRYHSWIADPAYFPACLAATSFDEEGNIMSLRHRSLPLYGTQFHPESVITRHGDDLFRAFLNTVSR